jgi:hypothetical protein
MKDSFNTRARTYTSSFLLYLKRNSLLIDLFYYHMLVGNITVNVKNKESFLLKLNKIIF